MLSCIWLCYFRCDKALRQTCANMTGLSESRSVHQLGPCAWQRQNIASRGQQLSKSKEPVTTSVPPGVSRTFCTAPECPLRTILCKPPACSKEAVLGSSALAMLGLAFSCCCCWPNQLCNTHAASRLCLWLMLMVLEQGKATHCGLGARPQQCWSLLSAAAVAGHPALQHTCCDVSLIDHWC